MSLPGLDRNQAWAYIAEINSTRQLLTFGLETNRNTRVAPTTRDPVLTMLSIGVEKLYKLTLGTIGLHRSGAWPSFEETKGRGHQVEKMHLEVMTDLRADIPPGKRSLVERLEEIESDKVLPPLISALDSYGRGGRFHYLDKLGSKIIFEDPEIAWGRIDAAAQNEPEVSRTRAAAFTDHLESARWNEYSAAAQRRIADSIDRVWDLISLSGQNRVFGELGVSFGAEIRINVPHRRLA